MRAARIRAVAEPQALRQAQCVAVRLPTGGGMGMRRFAENLLVTFHRALQLAPCPRFILVRHMILPADMVVAMNAGLEARIAHAAHNVGAFPADVRPGQQRAVQQGLDAVMLHHLSARYLAEKTGTEPALDRAPGGARAERKEERGLRVGALRGFTQTRPAFARAAIG